MILNYRSPALHGFLTFAIFVGLTACCSDTPLGFAAACMLSAIFAWFRPCYVPFVFGASFALLLAGLLSFLLIDGADALMMLPYMSISFASAALLGFVLGRFLKLIFIRFF